jgi:protein-disulfide isomerase
MNKLHTTLRMLRNALIPAVLLTGISPGIAPAEPATGDSASPAITQDTADAILLELKEIRRVLEKIEKQGGQPAQRPSKPTTATVAIEGKPSMGAADAPVTVVEFADYQCPFCLRFRNTTFPTLKQKYIDSGKVRWIAMNLPLQFHKDARKAAQAALCAGDQDKFWEMRTLLFRNPQKLAAEYLPGYAQGLSLNVAAFEACINSDRHLDDVDKEAKDANAVRLTGTPSFIIGETASEKISGQVVIGAQPLKIFDTAIQKALDQQAAKQKPAAAKPAG